jgi:hypothetical protein
MLSESRNLLMEQVSSKMVMPFAWWIKQKVRQCYPRPCAVSVTLLWARNLLNDVDSVGDRGVAQPNRIKQTNEVLFGVSSFYDFLCSSRLRSASVTAIH